MVVVTGVRAHERHGPAEEACEYVRGASDQLTEAGDVFTARSPDAKETRPMAHMEVLDAVQTGIAREVTGTEVRVERAAVGVVRAERVDVSKGAAGLVLAGGDVSLTQAGGRMFISGGDLRVEQGGSGMALVAGDAAISRGGVGSLISLGGVTVERGGIGTVITGRVEARQGSLIGIAVTPRMEVQAGARVIIGLREAFLVAVAGGIVAALVARVLRAR